jgi:hypothetical protein
MLGTKSLACPYLPFVPARGTRASIFFNWPAFFINFLI